MYVIDGYKHQEIGDKLGISDGTSKWHLSNARKELKKILVNTRKNLCLFIVLFVKYLPFSSIIKVRSVCYGYLMKSFGSCNICDGKGCGKYENIERAYSDDFTKYSKIMLDIHSSRMDKVLNIFPNHYDYLTEWYESI